MSARGTPRASYLLACLAAALTGCEHPTAIRETISAAHPHPAGAARVITPVILPTAGGSSQVVHPDVVLTPPSLFAYSWHLVLTPYPFGMALLENPFVYASADGLSWMVQPGVANPLARPRTGIPGELLSDPALVYVPESQQLWLYYRSYTADSDYIWLMRSPDAVRWDGPALVFAAGNGEAVSPSVVHRGPGDWLMWTVHGHCGSAGAHVDLRRSSDGLQWSAPEAATLDGLTPWHVFVRWIEPLGSWMMATNVKATDNSCLTRDLYLAFSSDGLRWTHGAQPWLSAGDDSLGLFATVVYRSAFVATGDSVRFWYSGATMMYRTYGCDRGQATCIDSSLRWSALGTEIRPVTDVLPPAIP